MNWGMFPITLEPKQLELLRDIGSVKSDSVTAPCLAFGTFQVDSDSADTFLSVDQWTKVVVLFGFLPPLIISRQRHLR